MVYVAGEYSLIFVSLMVVFNMLPLLDYTRFFMNVCLVMLYMIGLMNNVHELLFNVSGTVFIGE
ncbi:putative membrane protein [Vibrio phage vB_VchM_Kuja]|uniref:Putative membrane protein n=1 Tax=Vibrio phage vB_VchM_Kuja TaxID=2686437 RepID=A0A6B9J5P1_9CAUD|nr:hypothetical protein HWC83_gp159 [Vibrio phage vB_VchM_Kuja]QGZ16068.1 putative membrane protein [Vibrio phage vB_VchM_Kuja]